MVRRRGAGGHAKDIVALLNREMVKALALPDVKERMAGLGFATVGNTPEEFAVVIRSDGAKWAKVIRESGIKAQ